jgi:hypothetical protein
MTSEPHVTVKTIDDGGEFVILASDGLWKVKYLIKWESITCLMHSFALTLWAVLILTKHTCLIGFTHA